jgi:hypothetical protein
MRVPYEFDLLYDIKEYYEIEMVLKGEPHCSDASPHELEELMEAHGIPFPSWYERTKYQHPKEIWVDGYQHPVPGREPKRRPDLKVDQKVLVWDVDKASAKKRHFSHFGGDGKIYAFNCGNTSWSEPSYKTTSWNHYEVVEE